MAHPRPQQLETTIFLPFYGSGIQERFYCSCHLWFPRGCSQMLSEGSAGLDTWMSTRRAATCCAVARLGRLQAWGWSHDKLVTSPAPGLDGLRDQDRGLRLPYGLPSSRALPSTVAPSTASVPVSPARPPSPQVTSTTPLVTGECQAFRDLEMGRRPPGHTTGPVG